MSDLLQVILLGIVEGITEFLPVSSTGHLLIAEHLGLGQRSDVFNVVIQAGAILAVVLIYRQRLWELASGWARPDNRDYALKLLLAFVVTSVFAFAAVKLGFKLPEKLGPVAWALLIGGVWIIAAEWFAAKKPDSARITWTVAVAVGLAQVVAAIFPGTSRSGATIFVAMLLGTSNRAAATEFAFLVGIPTMFEASGYELLKSLKHGAGAENWADLGIAFAVSTVTAFVAVKWLLGYIVKHRFTVFAAYRIALGAALLLFMA
ncbi:MAG: undecaprenyl-diphosphate phosphatase [Nevskia sp.]|nr:undecaprenyl-diphosphate phosphatase [Nevskia sp.]